MRPLGAKLTPWRMITAFTIIQVDTPMATTMVIPMITAMTIIMISPQVPMTMASGHATMSF